MTGGRSNGAFTAPDVERLQLFDVALDAIIGMDSTGKVTVLARNPVRAAGVKKLHLRGRANP